MRKFLKDFFIGRKNHPPLYNNAYYIKYTKEHNKAFKEVEKELLGYNTKRGLKHDIDKVIMYHFMPVPLARFIHEELSDHHKKAKTRDDRIQMIIDMESARRTKPDKQLKPYQVIDRFYPEIRDEMFQLLRELGLPTCKEEE